MEKKVLNYIKEGLEKGLSKDQIKENLIKSRWPKEDVEMAFQELGLEEMTALPGIGTLFERTYDFYKERFWTLFWIMVLPNVAGYLAVNIWLLISSATFLTVPDFFTGFLQGAYSFAFLPAYILIIFLALWSQLAVMCAITQDKRIGIRGAFKMAWSKLLSFWWVSILSAILIIGASFFFLFPGIIFSIWFVFAAYVFLAEGKRGITAILQSKNLVSGYWWVVFIRNLFVVLISAGVESLAAAVPFGQTLTGLILRPFFYVFWFTFYNDLKRLKKNPQNWGSKKDKISIFLPFLLGLAVIAALVTLVATNDQILNTLKEFWALCSSYLFLSE